MCVVTFDPTAWKVRYPEFASVSDELATLYFNEAVLYLANTDSSPVKDCTRRAVLYGLLTAHIAFLAARAASGSAGLVGRISSATEGTVSVSTDATGIPGSAVWFAQSGYGLEYWQLTAQYRLARYVPGRSYPARGYGLYPWRR